jgi:hypothetical protein
MTIVRISTAVFLIVGAGLLDGTWANRWGPSPKLTALAARLDTVPMEIGGWKGTAGEELSPGERAMAGAVACLHRRYTNATRGVTVSVLLLGGLPGKIATHTPDVCYRGAGYQLESLTDYAYTYGPEQRKAEFKTAVASRGGTNPSALRIFWSWKASGAWKAPNEARWEFGPARTLSKLYVIREISGTTVAPESDPCNDFLAVLLPELDRCVFSVAE